jgi:FkbM family methyltransferase
MLSAVKKALPLGWRKTIKVRRARAFEFFGSYMYSQPSLHGLGAHMAARLPVAGVFLEVGANDGFSASNTYFLERARQWTGILIEPLPSPYERCRRVRPRATCVQAACVASAKAGETVGLVDHDLMSVTLGQQDAIEEASRLRGVLKTVTVPARTLSSIIDGSHFTRIDFMSIDVEGAELQLLAGLDLARHAPRWLLIETAHPDEVSVALAPYLTLTEKLSYHDYLYEALPRPL